MSKIPTDTQWEDLADRIQAKLDKTGVLDLFYPVGTYYETSDTTFDPNTAWGGTWVEDSAGLVTVAKDSGTFATVGDTGGEETHTLTTTEMPSHTHTLNRSDGGTGYRETIGYSGNSQTKQVGSWGVNNAGGGGAHNNLQPYIVVKRWHRTA